MSLHAQLSPEALAALHAQRRNSTISSILISILAIVLIGLVLGLFLLPALVKEVPEVVIYEMAQEEEAPVEKPRVKTVQNNPTPSSTSVAKVITAAANAPVSVPVPDVDFSAPSLEFGDTLDFNQSWGSSDAFSNIPKSLKKRCDPSERARRMEEAGGNVKCEKAVTKALKFLKKTQNEDGSWDDHYQTAMTGLSLLAFLGHCETPKSPEYGDTVMKAITYIISIGMKNDGKLTNDPGNRHWPYEHAIATYALGEAYTFCKDISVPIPNLESVTKKAGQIIVDGQAKEGGWNYGYGGGSDLSIIGWQLQALKAVDHSGIKLKKLTDCISKAMKNLETHQTPDGGFNYGRGGNNPKGGQLGYRNLTGVGVLCMQVWGKGKSKACRDGVKYISEHSKFAFNTGKSDIYGHYYDAQAMINAGGSEWEKYNKMIRDDLVKAQNSDGSWPMPGLKPNILTPTYRTALCTLILEVYYRFLPSADGSH